MSFCKIKAHFGAEALAQDRLGTLFRVKIPRHSDLVVGDNIELMNSRFKRLERRNNLIRKTRFGNQVLAANLDYVGIVLSVIPKTPDHFVDQIIIACREQTIQPFIIVTKLDLEGSELLLQEIRHELSGSVPILAGLPQLQDFLNQRARFIFVGVSGAGKSSLINQLIPDASQLIGALSQNKNQGRHTTSGSILLDLASGGELIDSPGVRDFSPVDLSLDQIAHHFAGFEKFAETSCQFRDCRHLQEPGCLVREQVNPRRYEKYLAMTKLL